MPPSPSPGWADVGGRERSSITAKNTIYLGCVKRDVTAGRHQADAKSAPGSGVVLASCRGAGIRARVGSRGKDAEKEK